MIFLLYILFSHSPKKGSTYLSIDRERTADMVSSRHPNTPVSNCGYNTNDHLERKKFKVVHLTGKMKVRKLTLNLSPAQYAAPKATGGPSCYPQ